MGASARAMFIMGVFLAASTAAIVGQAATITTFAASGDTLLVGSGVYQDRNFGGLGYLTSGRLYGSWEEPSLLRFDVSSLGSVSGLEVDSVTLRLTFRENGESGDPKVYAVAQANAGWSEGTIGGDEGAIQSGSACWNYKAYNTLGWAGSAGLGMSGTDYVATPLASNTVASSTANSQIDFTFTGTPLQLASLIQSWITGGASNPGLLLADPTSSGRIRYYSREATVAGYRPQLIVGYSIVPEPRTLALLASGLLGLLCRAWRTRK